MKLRVAAQFISPLNQYGEGVRALVPFVDVPHRVPHALERLGDRGLEPFSLFIKESHVLGVPRIETFLRGQRALAGGLINEWLDELNLKESPRHFHRPVCDSVKSTCENDLAGIHV